MTMAAVTVGSAKSNTQSGRWLGQEFTWPSVVACTMFLI